MNVIRPIAIALVSGLALALSILGGVWVGKKVRTIYPDPAPVPETRAETLNETQFASPGGPVQFSAAPIRIDGTDCVVAFRGPTRFALSCDWAFAKESK